MPANHKDQSKRDKKTGRYSARKLTPEQLDTIYRMGLIGCSEREVAAVLDIPNQTIDTWMQQDDNPVKELLEKGRQEGHTRLRRKMWALGMNGEGNTTMLIWLSKNLMGWRDSPEIALNVSATAHADARSPEAVKAHLMDLQEAMLAEAKRLDNGNGTNGSNGSNGL